MDGVQVALGQMLRAREERAQRQQALLAEFGGPLLCFTMNIAGPVKDNPLIRWGFRRGRRQLEEVLAAEGIGIRFAREVCGATGCEYYLVPDAPAAQVKALAVGLEEDSPLGRLYDMDVLDAEGRHLDRQELGLPGRTCLICGCPAKDCARSRTHTVAELQAKTEAILTAAQREADAERIGELAVRSLLYEVGTTPKPGLVDCRNSGSHADMDLFTFFSSAAALAPYFRQCAAVGMAGGTAGEAFARIRREGLTAEGEMRRATGGVNTHKGAIFSLGLACAGAGRLPREVRNDPARVLAEAAALAEGITGRDFAGVTAANAKTAGQKFYALYGITGVRGQAEAGFPAVLSAGLPKLEAGLAAGKSLNESGCAALLSLLAADTDTNLITRGGRQKQLEVTARVSELLAADPFPARGTLEAMDDRFIRENLSPGGSADLLALTYFVHFLKEEPYV